MYMASLGAAYERARARPQSTGYHVGQSCPAGQVKIGRTVKTRLASGKYTYKTECGIMPVVAAPIMAPPPPARITLQTEISPIFQQQFTPQVSPVIQVSTGGGTQTGGTEQTVPGGQAAASPTGITSTELRRILAQERAAEESRRISEVEERERLRLLEESRRFREAEDRERLRAAQAARDSEAAYLLNIQDQQRQQAMRVEEEQRQQAIRVEEQRFIDTGGAPVFIPQGGPVKAPSLPIKPREVEKVNKTPLIIGVLLLGASALYFSNPKKGRKQ